MLATVNNLVETRITNQGIWCSISDSCKPVPGAINASKSNLTVWATSQRQNWGLHWNLHLQAALPCVCPAHPCWFVSLVSGWVSAWQLGATFSQAAAHWCLKPPIHNSGSISKDLLLSSHDFIIIIIALWNAVAEPTTKHEAHVLYGTICFLHSHHHKGFPLSPPPPIPAHCWRGSRWSSAAMKKSSWGVPPPSLLCPGVTLVGKRPFEGLFNNRSQLTIWYKEHRAGQRLPVWWMRESLFANLGLGFLVFFFSFFNWSIVNLQYYIIFKYTAKWFRYICVCIYI